VSISRVQIIVKLGPMLVRQRSDRFELDDHPSRAHQIRNEPRFQQRTAVSDLKLGMGNKPDAAGGKLDFQTFLVDRFQKPTPKFLIKAKERPKY
jgi:hypothetical protein